MIYKKIKRFIFTYVIEWSVSLITTGFVFVVLLALTNQQLKQYEKTLKNQLQKFEIISRVFTENIDGYTQDRGSIIKKLDELRNALSWCFKFSFEQDQNLGQIKIPIIVDGSGFNIENRKKIAATIFDKTLQVYQSEIIYSKPFVFNQETFYLVLSMAIRNDIAISIDQVNLGPVESYKIHSSHHIFSLMRSYWVVFLSSFFLSFFIAYWILKKITIKAQKHIFLLYKKRFKSVLSSQLEIYDLKKRFFTSLNNNKLLTNKLSESAKTYVAMSDKTIHLLRQLPQTIETPEIKSDNGILVYDIFRKKEQHLSKIVDEALSLLSGHFQQKKSVPYFFESKSDEVFLGDHDFIFFALYLIFKEIIGIYNFSKETIEIRSHLTQDRQLIIELRGFLEEVTLTELDNFEFISVSFSKNKKLLKIIFEGVLMPERLNISNINVQGKMGDNVVKFVKP
jgi:hypothetical protein